MELVLVSGVSGSGKSIALKSLEDLGFFCVDNLPLELLGNLVFWYKQQGNVAKLAVSIDSRSKTNFKNLKQVIKQLKQEENTLSILFLESKDEILIKRYSETKRLHPLQKNYNSLIKAIKQERIMLQSIKEEALVLDTSYMQVQSLRRWILDWAAIEVQPFQLTFESFGFKYGIPLDADYIFDIRCLPNPYYSIELRHLTGLDENIKVFFQQYPQVEKMILSISDFLNQWLGAFQISMRSNLIIAIGCTGGVHRSVYVVERLVEIFRKNYSVLLRHRQLDYKS